MTGNIWSVPATVLRVVDADTLELLLDLGWRITFKSRCRVVGVGAAELDTEQGREARTAVVELLASVEGANPAGRKVGENGRPLPPEYGAQVVLVSHALDKYGRPLGEIVWATAQGERMNLGNWLIEAGLAGPI
jgi:endonuclease YncB( thermonuclease family)